MNILNQYKRIKKNILDNSLSKIINLIVVTKNRSLADIQQIINIGHIHFGENRAQEGINKWKDILKLNPNIKLHFLGKLQSNKAADVVNYFDYIHSLDSNKLALKLSIEEKRIKRNLSYFIQVNLGEENQKSGIIKQDLSRFLNYCKNDLELNVIGLMCLPPINENAEEYFMELQRLAFNNNLRELSMGMSNDYVAAIKNGATYVRIGSGIFEEN